MSKRQQEVYGCASGRHSQHLSWKAAARCMKIADDEEAAREAAAQEKDRPASIIDGHSKLEECNAQYQSALEDARGDYDEETIDGGGAFDISISIALLYPQEVAEEFLRGQWGYVPQTYLNLIVHKES